jgi:capsular exopolysaccharide synthesis family protein
MELRDYARGLRRHWLAIVLMILVGVGISFLWVRMQTPVYEASVDGIAKSQSDGSEEQGFVQVGDPAASAKIPAFLVMADWPDVAEYVIEDLELDTTPEQLSTQVDVTNPQGTTILNVVARAESPTAARALAESWIRGMVHTIDEVDGTGTAGSAPVNIVAGGSASLPSEPLFPDLRTSLIVGAVIGLGFGIGFALMRTASDRRVRAADEVEKKTEVSVVGTIPLAKQMDVESRLFDPEASGSGPGFAVAEAMRTLRTNLQFMDVDNPPRTIVVTSPLPGDGKSTIACNLALTLAASGSTVTLVDGDLRRSKVAETMGVTRGAGLSDVLAGRADVADVLQRSPQSQNLFILAAGSAPPNPSEVLGSARMKSLLSDLAEHSIVIVDAPPLIPVTDGAVLTHQADGALLVVSLGKTTYDLVEKALDTLHKARGRALGIVLNKAPLKGVDASPYSYEYRRQYGQQVPSGAEHVAQPPAAAPAAAESSAFPPRPPDERTNTPVADGGNDARPAEPYDEVPVAASFAPPAGEPLADLDDDQESYDPLSAFDELIEPDETSDAGEDPAAPRRHRARRS